MRPILTITGYVFILFGFLGLILSLTGLGIFPLSLLDKHTNPLIAFAFKVLLIVVGFILFYVTRVQVDEEEELSGDQS